MRFHCDPRKTYLIYGSWRHIYGKWWKLQRILSMMAESLPDSMVNLDQLTQFTKVWTILTASRQGIQAISMTTASDSSDTCSNGRNLCDIYGDGSIHNPKYSMDIQARLTKVTEDSSDYYSDGRTCCDSRRLVRPYVTILFNHTHPVTFFAVNDYNDKYSGGVEAGGKQFFYD